MVIIQRLVESLLVTILLEELLAWLFGMHQKKNLLLVLLVNVLTNPLVVICYYLGISFIQCNSWYIKLVLEGMAVICEALYYQRYGEQIKHPWFLSILLNGFSFGSGIILF